MLRSFVRRGFGHGRQQGCLGGGGSRRLLGALHWSRGVLVVFGPTFGPFSVVHVVRFSGPSSRYNGSAALFSSVGVNCGGFCTCRLRSVVVLVSWVPLAWFRVFCLWFRVGCRCEAFRGLVSLSLGLPGPPVWRCLMLCYYVMG